MSTFLRSPLLSGAGVAAALIAAVVWTQPAGANDPQTPPPAVKVDLDDPALCYEEPPVEPTPQREVEKPLIEVVFVIDTTGSMSSLIEGAKRKVWSIANEILSAKPRPRLSVGLVAYRDYRDAYVTQVFQPTEDLDGVYGDLMGFSAGGGGDGPEHVNMALCAAFGLSSTELHVCSPNRRCAHQARQGQQQSIQWSDEAQLKLVYLVGDAPAHRDYDQHIDFAKTVPLARQSQLTVNAVLCGADPNAQIQFSEIARLGGGQFFQIAQSGGMTAVATPHDDELRRLQRELEATRLYYGRADVRREAEGLRGRALEMDGEEGAARAAALSKSDYVPGPADDLVAGVAAGAPAPAMDGLDEALMPEQFQGLSNEARQAKVEELAAQRKQVEAKIKAVVQDRDTYLREHQPKDGFDARVMDSLKENAEELGLSWDE